MIINKADNYTLQIYKTSTGKIYCIFFLVIAQNNDEIFNNENAQNFFFLLIYDCKLIVNK